MFRLNIAVLGSVLVLCLSLKAQSPPKSASHNSFFQRTATITFTSWTELVDLDNGMISDQAFSNFYGLTLGIARKAFATGKWGQVSDASLLYGQANLGGTSTLVPYQASHRPYWGASASYRLAYRHSPTIVASLGPLLLFRQINWPAVDPNVDVKSGAAVNLGLIADLQMRLDPHWELRQSFGTLVFKASTLWGFGLNYIY